MTIWQRITRFFKGAGKVKDAQLKWNHKQVLPTGTADAINAAEGQAIDQVVAKVAAKVPLPTDSAE